MCGGGGLGFRPAGLVWLDDGVSVTMAVCGSITYFTRFTFTLCKTR